MDDRCSHQSIFPPPDTQDTVVHPKGRFSSETYPRPNFLTSNAPTLRHFHPFFAFTFSLVLAAHHFFLTQATNHGSKQNRDGLPFDLEAPSDVVIPLRHCFQASKRINRPRRHGQFKIGRIGEDNEAVNLRYRKQIDDLRTKLRSLEKQAELGASDTLFDSQSTEDRVDLGSMVRMEEFRAKLRVAEQQASGAKPVSAVDVILQSFNGNSQPTVSLDSVRPTFESGPTSDMEIPPPSGTLRPSSLPIEVEELQKMVMAYHRFTKHTLENAENEKKKAVREAEERMKKKYLPVIAELEKANAELKGNQKQKFRLF
eukprot:scaffold5364_cov164-Amphora_coffeaeformis.AAC.21